MKNKFSVIVPVSNSERTIENTIHSIYSSKNVDVECIVIVNNTDDNSYEISLKLQDKYPSLIVINSDCKGVSEARNEGLKRASGKYIAFSDSDDLYTPYALDKVDSVFEKTDADIVVTRFNFHELSGAEYTSKSFGNRFVSLSKFQEMVILDPNIMGSVCNKFYRKEVVENVLFDATITHCEDTHFNMQILKKDNLKIYLSDAITYRYFENSESATRNEDKLFDCEGNLRYLAAFDSIKEMYSDSSRIEELTGFKKFSLAVFYYNNQLSDKRKKRLEEIIKLNIKYINKIGLKYRLTDFRKTIIDGKRIDRLS